MKVEHVYDKARIVYKCFDCEIEDLPQSCNVGLRCFHMSTAIMACSMHACLCHLPALRKPRPHSEMDGDLNLIVVL